MRVQHSQLAPRPSDLKRGFEPVDAAEDFRYNTR